MTAMICRFVQSSTNSNTAIQNKSMKHSNVNYLLGLLLIKANRKWCMSHWRVHIYRENTGSYTLPRVSHFLEQYSRYNGGGQHTCFVHRGQFKQ